MVFATYGLHENFWDETDRVKQLFQDKIDGFFPLENVMGGDPEFGFNKTLIIIFEYKGKLYYYTHPNGLPKITKDTLRSVAAEPAQ